MKRYLFSTHAGLAVEAVLKGLTTAHLVTIVNVVVVCTGDDQVAALLDKLDTAERIETAGQATPTNVAKLTQKAKRAENLFKAESPAPNHVTGKRPYHYNGGETIKCPKCGNPVSSMFMLKDKTMCKACNRNAKRAPKSQAGAKSQEQDTHPDTWTNQKPDFGHQEAISQIRDKPKETINMAKLSGVRVG